MFLLHILSNARFLLETQYHRLQSWIGFLSRLYTLCLLTIAWNHSRHLSRLCLACRAPWWGWECAVWGGVSSRHLILSSNWVAKPQNDRLFSWLYSVFSHQNLFIFSPCWSLIGFLSYLLFTGLLLFDSGSCLSLLTSIACNWAI